MGLMSLKKISYEIFSKVVDFFQKIVTKLSEGAIPIFYANHSWPFASHSCIPIPADAPFGGKR